MTCEQCGHLLETIRVLKETLKEQQARINEMEITMHSTGNEWE